MLKILSIAVFFLIALVYILFSAFAPTGKVVAVKGFVLASGPAQFWLASDQGIFKVVYVALPSCTSSLTEDRLGFGSAVEASALITDTFQMSACSADNGYVKIGSEIYPALHYDAAAN